MSSASYRLAAILLLLLGVELWLLVGRSHWGTNLQLKLVAVELILLAIPAVHRRAGKWLDAVREPSPRVRAIVAWCIVPVAIVYLYVTAMHQGRLLFPHTHDERMYVLQARMLATGRLWMAQHPAADSFETPYLIVKPVYAAMYFPGAAMLYAIGEIARLPELLIPLLVAGASAAFLFRVVTELTDAVAGGLAGLMLLSLEPFRYLSTMYLSHGVMLLLGLMLLWTWLRWRRHESLGWAVMIGVIAGWAAITRPVDALCYAIPVGVAILWRLRSMPMKRGVSTAALILAGATPFLTIQLVFDYGVTGHLLQTPIDFYNRIDAPGVRYGFADANALAARPKSSLLQKQALYDDMVRPALEAQRGKSLFRSWIDDRFPWMSRQVLPSQWMLVFIPLGSLAARKRHWACIAVLPLFVAAYAGFAWLLAHYCVIGVPAVFLLVLLGGQALASAWPRGRLVIATSFAVVIATLCITSMPQVNRLVRDEWWFHPPITEWDHDRLAQLVHRPVIVLYRFHEGGNPYDEPVYNTNVANPDDAPIIRAQDLSDEQNRKLFEYYARIDPSRRVYRVDRSDTMNSTGELSPIPLGTVADLARTPATSP
jgi:hypothetical protein